MANPTTNYGFVLPTSTDLVTDLPADFDVALQGVDTRLKALQPGTTSGDLAYSSATANTNVRLGIGTNGQVLAVSSGVPAWTTTADVTPLTTKGDLFTFTTVDARIGVGANDTVLTADSAEASGLKWATPVSGAVNKNYLINGGFAIAQRGTSFTSALNNDDAYTLDRFYILSDGNDIIDVTQNTSTIPTNGQFAIALDVETVNKKFGIATIIENKDCIGLIGNTVTFSFKAKVSATTQLDNVKCAIVAWSGTADTVTSDIISAWGVEGTNPTLIANATYENTPANLNLTTSYASYSVSAAVDTASTKNIILFIWSDVTTTTLGDFLFIAEAKLELGSSATAFEYAGGTLQGELASCQRYFNRFSNCSQNTNQMVAIGRVDALLTESQYPVRNNVTMRANPTFTVSAAADYFVDGSSRTTPSAITAGELTPISVNLVVVHGGISTYSVTRLFGQNSSGTMDLSAEL